MPNAVFPDGSDAGPEGGEVRDYGVVYDRD